MCSMSEKNSTFKNKINIQAILEPTCNLRAQIQSQNFNGYHFHYELTEPPDLIRNIEILRAEKITYNHIDIYTYVILE